GPLAYEERLVLFAGKLQRERPENGREGRAKKDTAGQGRGLRFKHCGKLVFVPFAGAHTIVGHSVSLTNPKAWSGSCSLGTEMRATVKASWLRRGGVSSDANKQVRK